MIENEIFKKCIPDYKKIIQYGFHKTKEGYCYRKIIMNQSFEIRVLIDLNHQVYGSVFDLEMEDEYLGFRVENAVGEFAGKIREEFCALLEDIRNQCFMVQNFVSEQANRINHKIYEAYGDQPFFEWDSYPDFGVFKNKDTKKWYALIMNISRKKLEENSDEMVDVLNVKLDSDKIGKLITEKGFFPAYHMNKKYWITIVLDDTISDDEVFSYIEESYQYTIGRKMISQEWIVPANPKYYDIEFAFQQSSVIQWKQSSDIQIGDIVYIYVGAPISALLYKCVVRKNYIPFEYYSSHVQMKYTMELELLEQYSPNLFPFSLLGKYGVRAIRGPRHMSLELHNYIEQKTR